MAEPAVIVSFGTGSAAANLAGISGNPRRPEDSYRNWRALFNAGIVTGFGGGGVVTNSTTSAHFFYVGGTGSTATQADFRAIIASDLDVGGLSGQALVKIGAEGLTWATFGTGNGSVFSVALSLPTIFTVSGSPVTTTGTLTGALATQSSNTLFAGPATGSATTPTFRRMVSFDAATGGSVGQALMLSNTSTGLMGWTNLGTGNGTVLSVGLSLPNLFIVTNSPVTTSGTLTGTLATQSANTFFSGPSSGSAASPTFRLLAAADIPSKVLFNHFTDAPNSTTAETDLYSDSIAAGQLATNGDKLEGECGGVFVSSGTATREVRIYFGGTMIFDTGALTLSLSSAWTSYVTIIRVSASVVRYMVSFTTEGAALAAYTAVGEVAGLTLANAQVMKITGQAAGIGAASSDIVAKMGYVEYKTA